VAEICEMGTDSTGSATLKNPAVAQDCGMRTTGKRIELMGLIIHMGLLTVTKMGWIVVR